MHRPDVAVCIFVFQVLESFSMIFFFILLDIYPVVADDRCFWGVGSGFEIRLRKQWRILAQCPTLDSNPRYLF